MLEVPGDGLADAFLEHGLGIPADLCLDLVRRDGLSSVMSLTVFHVSDQIVVDMCLAGIGIGKHLL